jgi:chaperonin GroEL
MEHLGVAHSIDVTKFGTTLVGAKGDYEEIEKRIEDLKLQIVDENTSIHDCQRLQERITRLASGIAVIRVGAATEIEMIEKKHRIEDALEAVRSAQDEGVHIGAGVPLIRAAKNLKVKTDNATQQLGVKIIQQAIKEPLRQICENAGVSADLVINKVEKSKNNMGFSLDKRNMIDYHKEGIIDPVKVTRCALQNAVSAAGTLLTTNYAIVEKC